MVLVNIMKGFKSRFSHMEPLSINEPEIYDEVIE